MRGSLGLVIGLVVGAGGMYLALRPPWGGGHATAPSDAALVVYTPTDAGTKPKPKKRRPGHVAQPQQGSDDGGDEVAPPIVLTAADRALEWRGDEVALGPQKVDMAGGDARPLDDAEINSGIAGADALRGCVVSEATGTDLKSTITVKMIVEGGRVTKSKLQAPHYLFEHGLLGCAQRALRAMHFATTGAPTLVTFPVNLG